MKLLLYCTKGKPYLVDLRKDFNNVNFDIFDNKEILNTGWNILNGKIVGECDFEVHEIIHTDITDDDFSYGYYNGKKNVRICKDSCLTKDEIFDYLYNGYVDNGYAIHIKNLKIFDEPSELSNYLSYITKNEFPELNKPIEKAPQNMMYCYLNDDGEYYDDENEAILISIRPEWLCKILNGEKTIEVRKRVLKGMIEK